MIIIYIFMLIMYAISWLKGVIIATDARINHLSPDYWSQLAGFPPPTNSDSFVYWDFVSLDFQNFFVANINVYAIQICEHVCKPSFNSIIPFHQPLYEYWFPTACLMLL